MADRLVDYQAPSWASTLKYTPTAKVKLAMTPTPIHEWKRLPGTPEDFTVYIKRDDMTGSVLTGNKVRKLEFLLADAIQRSCTHVITGGAACSNHCRTTAAACAELGLKSHLFLCSESMDVSKVKYDGNMLVSKLVGAQVYLVPIKEFDNFETEVFPRMVKLADELREQGEKAALIPLGGTNVIGLWSYIQCFEEIRQQGVEFDDMVCICGTGGTLSGLAIANYLCGSPYKIHGISIDPAIECLNTVDKELSELGLADVCASDIVNVYTDYIGIAYAVNQPHELEYMARAMAETGIMLDTAYTGKAAYGLSDLMKNRPEVFKGRRILFIHSDFNVSMHINTSVNPPKFTICQPFSITCKVTGNEYMSELILVDESSPVNATFGCQFSNNKYYAKNGLSRRYNWSTIDDNNCRNIAIPSHYRVTVHGVTSKAMEGALLYCLASPITFGRNKSNPPQYRSTSILRVSVQTDKPKIISGVVGITLAGVTSVLTLIIIVITVSAFVISREKGRFPIRLRKFFPLKNKGKKRATDPQTFTGNQYTEAGGFSYTTYETALGQDDFPRSSEPVVILGRAYSTLYDYEDLKKDVLTRPWITYRKGYSPIGGTGPTTDQGWGCMLRCGQMMLCQSLMNLHLPPKWRWTRDSLGGNPTYRKILGMFVDTKLACYSIHQIASMGVSEGKEVGQWFGPNTIAHVMKKLTSYDDWNNIVIHVAMDNTVVIDDIKTLCRTAHTSSGVNLQFEADTSLTTSVCTTNDSLPSLASPHTSFIAEGSTWRPLLLVVPLRLGISTINEVYLSSLKRFFELPYSVGVLGGKPNHAHWFIGYTGNELVFLDPHTTQPVVESKPDGMWDDSSYHCSIAGRMKISSLDPSMALGFFCKTEKELDDLAKLLSNERASVAPMFEVCLNRPRHLPPPRHANPHGTDTVVPSPKYDTDDEYELV